VDVAAGALVGWLHPWKGAVLLLVLAGLAAWDRLAPRVRVLAVPAAATALPIAYLALLPRLDPTGRPSQPATRRSTRRCGCWSRRSLPLAAVAALGTRAAARDQAGRILLLWPPAALLVYLGIAQFPVPRAAGLTIPLAVLAALGWQRMRWPRWQRVACVAVVTLPGAVFLLDTFQDSRRSGIAPYVLHPDEHAALRHLADAPRGRGVLTRFYLGTTVPGLTGHDTWLGNYPWSPDFFAGGR
jgi:hypothetical protein